MATSQKATFYVMLSYPCFLENQLTTTRLALKWSPEKQSPCSTLILIVSGLVNDLNAFSSSQLTFGAGGSAGVGRPYSSLALRDYDPLSDTYGMDQSRSYLGGRSLSGGAASSLDGHLRDTTISGLGAASGDPYDADRNRFLASRRFVGQPSAKAAQRGELKQNKFFSKISA